jgi:methyl-CpG-binding domain protein 4
MSPYGLLQEEINYDPWKIFVCCIFCNLTKRVSAEPYFRQVLNLWPQPANLACASEPEVAAVIQPLGLSKRRAKALIRMSKDYLSKEWQDDPTKLYGIGKYGSDAYKIFCTPDWKEVEPKDGALVNYHNWLKEFEDARRT